MLNIKKIHFRPGIYQTVFGFKGHRTEMFALFFYPCLDSMSFGLWQGLIDMLDCCCSLFNNRCLLWRHLSTVLQILIVTLASLFVFWALQLSRSYDKHWTTLKYSRFKFMSWVDKFDKGFRNCYMYLLVYVVFGSVL